LKSDKRRKLAEMFLHPLEETVMGSLRSEVLPLLAELHSSSQAAFGQRELQKGKITSPVWRSVIPALPELLDEQSATRDVTKNCNSLSRSIFESFSFDANRQWTDCVINCQASAAEIKLYDDANFADIAVEHPRANGRPLTVVGVDYQRLHAALGKMTHRHVVSLASNAPRNVTHQSSN
jgi:hypothetical protein